ncbi:uncharacterized protein FMAN_12727 [Fusarium mangiferae]|uniref:Metallothionein n=1 Tax=Fusarium mangiferae TaxID=192010 RepID=A0A1L7UBY0_FUSMA|nr:uncharacterized protein FMAN_12727 [Fusarium mangiferae]CVL04616.1 uncharacterized protein FMAN_12727 [Fusarium mangiferae]
MSGCGCASSGSCGCGSSCTCAGCPTGTLMDETWGMGTRMVVNDGSTHYFLSALECKSQN